jgi:peptidoglycan hydrolase-like protein with peptidoglycan-binding domain
MVRPERPTGNAVEQSKTDGRSGGTGPMSGQPTPQHDASTIREVQQALQGKGFDVGPIDGVMGPRTAAALREFQQQRGLNGSGRLDRETLSALNVRTGS